MSSTAGLIPSLALQRRGDDGVVGAGDGRRRAWRAPPWSTWCRVAGEREGPADGELVATGVGGRPVECHRRTFEPAVGTTGVHRRRAVDRGDRRLAADSVTVVDGDGHGVGARASRRCASRSRHRYPSRGSRSTVPAEVVASPQLIGRGVAVVLARVGEARRQPDRRTSGAGFGVSTGVSTIGATLVTSTEVVSTTVGLTPSFTEIVTLTVALVVAGEQWGERGCPARVHTVPGGALTIVRVQVTVTVSASGSSPAPLSGMAVPSVPVYGPPGAGGRGAVDPDRGRRRRRARRRRR